SFYQNCYNALKSDGVLVAQGESPKFNEKAFCELNHTLQDIFGRDKAPVSLFFVPTYPTGMWSFQYGLKGNIDAIKHLDNGSIDGFVEHEGLRYYNSALHAGSFALPNFVKSLLSKSTVLN
ncbi:MAG: spermidine synthase, partial [Bacteroidota bacterium]